MFCCPCHRSLYMLVKQISKNISKNGRFCSKLFSMLYFLFYFRSVSDELDEFFKQQSDISVNVLLHQGNVGQQATNHGNRNLSIRTCCDGKGNGNLLWFLETPRIKCACSSLTCRTIPRYFFFFFFFTNLVINYRLTLQSLLLHFRVPNNMYI